MFQYEMHSLTQGGKMKIHSEAVWVGTLIGSGQDPRSPSRNARREPSVASPVPAPRHPVPGVSGRERSPGRVPTAGASAGLASGLATQGIRQPTLNLLYTAVRSSSRPVNQCDETSVAEAIMGALCCVGSGQAATSGTTCLAARNDAANRPCRQRPGR